MYNIHIDYILLHYCIAVVIVYLFIRPPRRRDPKRIAVGRRRRADDPPRPYKQTAGDFADVTAARTAAVAAVYETTRRRKLLASYLFPLYYIPAPITATLENHRDKGLTIDLYYTIYNIPYT